MCDVTRTFLQERGILGDYGDEVLEKLGHFIREECLGNFCIDIETIKHTRLDKLLLDVARFFYPPASTVKHITIPTVAASLERQWNARFKSHYADLDGVRMNEMSSIGLLKGVTFIGSGTILPAPTDFDKLWMSTPTNEDLSELEGNNKFLPGEYVT